MSFVISDTQKFVTTIEVVPPAGNDPASLLDKLAAISDLDFSGFSVATNPVAKPRMSAMVFCHLLHQKTGKPAILHLTVRDHNLLGLQAELWGAKALGIDTLIAVTGDPSAGRQKDGATAVNDVNVYQLITLANESGLTTGAVLDFRPERNGLKNEVKRLEKKVAAGSRFIVTQPVYDEPTAKTLADACAHLPVPKIMGILPLLSFRHATFLHDKVDGIAVPDALRREMETSADPVRTGTIQAKHMLEIAKLYFSGACVMPPFERFEILKEIL
ncbi:MAG: methylenetetrahydrofolate reductase [Desulfotignum balticum]|uniref:Methylenetetrahydrofolate reductase n=1 Tax=Desulfotignum balticum TaxID=115781 RepID=A0A931CZY1_9BACT|nr:methylenetetrahydrofolate reductase [Desulfotignum balticum]